MHRGKAQPQVLRRLRPPVEGSFCGYSHRRCMQNRLDGYEFCVKHILEDKNAPYKQCNYISQRNGKRCPSAAPKADKKDGYCIDHARRASLLRSRASRKRRPRETPDTLLEQIEHYASKRNEIGGAGDGVLPPGRDGRRVMRGNDSVAGRILDYATSSDSDEETTLIDQAWRGDGDSDAESVDSEQEDILKHAGVYTAEEVALVTRDKLIRLQSLYIDQFKRLQHVMREKRRRYLHASSMERDTLGSVSSVKDDPEQREKYDKLVAMKRYHRRFGKEALLHRQSKERRIELSEGPNYKPPAHPRCAATEANKKCGARTVPLSKFCSRHMMQDPLQVLYRPCGYGNGVCQRPVVVGMTASARCSYHQSLEDHSGSVAGKEEMEEKEEEVQELSVDVVSDQEFHLPAGTSPSVSISTTTDDASSQPRAGSRPDLGQEEDMDQIEPIPSGSSLVTLVEEKTSSEDKMEVDGEEARVEGTTRNTSPQLEKTALDATKTEEKAEEEEVKNVASSKSAEPNKDATTQDKSKLTSAEETNVEKCGTDH